MENNKNTRILNTGMIITIIILVLLAAILFLLYRAKTGSLRESEEFVEVDPTFNETVEGHISELLALIEEDPQNVEYWQALGGRYYALGEYKKAREALEQAIVLSPNDYLSYSILGDVAKDMGDSVVAEESYKKAIARNMRFDNGYIKLTDYYRSLERFSEAEEYYLLGIDTTGSSYLMKRYANLLDYMGKYQAAIDYWNLALPLEPENAENILEEIAELEEKLKAE